MNYVFLLTAWLLALVLGMAIVPKILLISYKKRLFDIPDERKVHTIPVPRLGGLSFFPVILITMCLMLGIRYYLGYPIENLSPYVVLYEFLFFAVGITMLYLTGVTDDLIGVGYRYKFLVQIAAALLLVWSGEWFNSLGGLFGIYDLPVYIGIPVTLFVVVYITNAINLIDGIDGLASGLCCIALVVLGMMCTLQGEYIFAMLAFTTFGVIVPFWFYNVFGNAKRGHKLFMGDAGSLTLGYIISLLVIHLSRIDMNEGEAGQVNLVLSFSTLIVPLFDVVRVVMHRVREGKNPFMPDKNHFHHKLLRTGMRPRIVMVTILFVALFFIVLNWLLIDLMRMTGLLITDIVLWILLQLGINHGIKKKQRNQENHRCMNKYKPICLLLILLSVVAALSSCGSSKQVVYFQDLKPGETEFKLPEIKTITVRPEDKISIIVNSRDPQLTDLFNLPYVSRQLGQSLRTNGITVSNNQGVSAYTIDTNGEIDFPVLGKMYVAGMKREEIAEYIKNELIKENLVKDPVVTVEFANLCISVLGEVNNPGRFSIDRDRLTVLDALSMAGDLTIYGNRYKVMVLRQEGDVQRVYGIDLTSGEHVYTSPAYYLQQNDVVYVEPNAVKARQSTVNGNNVRSTSFWISLASLLTSIGILIFN